MDAPVVELLPRLGTSAPLLYVTLYLSAKMEDLTMFVGLRWLTIISMHCFMRPSSWKYSAAASTENWFCSVISESWKQKAPYRSLCRSRGT